MGDRWYHEFFSPRFWEFFNVEYSPERTSAETAYLIKTLASAPGKRVIDLGCGTGRHAIALAEAGFEVTGLDVSEWAVAEASKRAADSGVEARFEVVDLLSSGAWPVGVADAAYAIQSFGWGADHEQRRLLETVRSHLVPGGLLVLDFSSAVWILANYRESDSTELNNVTYSFRRRYDARAGRSRTQVTISGPGVPDLVAEDDLRIYTPAEAEALVRESGFRVERMDDDFVGNAPLTRETRYAQVVARALPGIDRALALSTHAGAGAVSLDLRMASDEIDLVDPSPREVWQSLVSAEIDHAFEIARSYPVTDPFGAARGAAALSRHFGFTVSPETLTFGAGVTSLLRAAVALADRGPVLTTEVSHPDLPAWAAESGCSIFFVTEPLSIGSMIQGINDHSPALVHLDRPRIDGLVVATEALASLAAEAASLGAIVVIDEAYASYFPPSASAARVALSSDNVVVMRSVSKAYSLGGLRIGYALASEPITRRLRTAIPPLQVSELAYRFALEVLSTGDCSAPLRRRVGEVKAQVVEALTSKGIEVVAGHPDLPWVLLPDPAADVAKSLLDRGIAVKRIVHPHGSPARPSLRLSLPLSAERLANLEDLLSR